jgi:hypothetical protein
MSKIVEHKVYGKGTVINEKGDFYEVDFRGSLRLVPKSEVKTKKKRGVTPEQKTIKKGTIQLELK